MGLWSALSGSNAWADIYKYVGQDGVVYYADKPLHAGYRLLFKATNKPVAQPAVRRGNRPKVAAAARHYADLIALTAAKYQLDPGLLHAVIRAESGYNPAALSPKGAVGLMQLMPATAERFGASDRFDPRANVEAGARYLSHLLALFQYDLRLALAAYNAGENAVIKNGYQIPPFQETQVYVGKVLAFYRDLKGGRS